ncbi:MAG: multiheme c-type cytochrome [Nitrospinota bacterium]
MCALFLLAAMVLVSVQPAGAREEKESRYVGSEVCATCHRLQHNDFVLSGHPYKLRKARDARAQGLPLPEGYTWDDISYVIGGRNWKVRYVDKKGYIITSTGPNRDRPGRNQFDLETGRWVDYHPGEKNKKYNCGRCHTTGYSSKGHEDGLPGIVGTWAFPGVQCEACHGPGKEHVARGGDKRFIRMETLKTLCGRCHVRGKPGAIPARNGFIRHHEQYNELLASPHRALDCTTCHDPHKRAKFAIKIECERCHSTSAAEFAGSRMHLRGVQCIDCHMPEATKSAVAKGKYRGDIRTHLYRINLDPQARMFTKDGRFANGFLTVEFACLACHGEKDRAWAIAASKGVHALGKR